MIGLSLIVLEASRGVRLAVLCYVDRIVFSRLCRVRINSQRYPGVFAVGDEIPVSSFIMSSYFQTTMKNTFRHPVVSD